MSRGTTFRLFTKFAYYSELDAESTPEIMRVRLDSVVLLLKAMGVNDLISFDMLTKPPTNALVKALEDLYSLGALNEAGQLTRVGRKLASLPVAPDLARVILAADEFGCVEEVLTIVAMLQESGSLWLRPRDKKLHADAARARFTSKEGGDFLTLLNVFNAWTESDFDPSWCMENYIQAKVLNRVRQVKEQLYKLADRVEISTSSSNDHIAIRKAFCRGFFAKAARLSRGGDTYRTCQGGNSVYLHPSSTLRESRPKWVIYFEIAATSKEYMRNCFPLDDPAWLLEAAPHAYKKDDLEKLGWDKKMGKTRG
jgi:pre-mRNA-splicing factor ATP-dependent RNA helicase DHX16